MAELFDILTYDYVKESDVLDVPETYTELASLTTPERGAGIYNVGFSLTAVFPVANKSLFVRFAINGGDFTEWRWEPQDSADTIPIYYAFPSAQTSGSKTLVLEARKEDVASPQLDISFCDLFIQRVQ